MLLVDYKMQ